MITTDKGLKVYEEGDVVRIGKGRVHWVVKGLLEGEYVHLESQAGQKRYAEYGNVTLVQNVRDTDEWKNAHSTSGYLVGREPLFSEEEQAQIMRDVDGESEEEPVVETSAYAKAVLFALNRLQNHVYAGTVRRNVKAKRRALNRRQKASRKANR